MLIAALWINGAYRYWNEIYPSPQEIQVRKIEFCNQIGFPKTTLVLLQQNRYEYTKTQLERLKRAEAAAQKKVSAAPAAK
jgi:hypothetical protein